TSAAQPRPPPGTMSFGSADAAVGSARRAEPRGRPWPSSALAAPRRSDTIEPSAAPAPAATASVVPQSATSPSAARMRAAVSAIAASSAYAVRGQKKPRRPSPLRRGTTWTCRCGTLWLTLLLIATNVPSAPIAASTALLRRCARRKSGPISSAGSSASVPTCWRGISSTWPRNTGRWSRKATQQPSSSTACTGTSPAATRQKAQAAVTRRSGRAARPGRRPDGRADRRNGRSLGPRQGAPPTAGPTSWLQAPLVQRDDLVGAGDAGVVLRGAGLEGVAGHLGGGGQEPGAVDDLAQAGDVQVGRELLERPGQLLLRAQAHRHGDVAVAIGRGGEGPGGDRGEEHRVGEAVGDVEMRPDRAGHAVDERHGGVAEGDPGVQRAEQRRGARLQIAAVAEGGEQRGVELADRAEREQVGGRLAALAHVRLDRVRERVDAR